MITLDAVCSLGVSWLDVHPGDCHNSCFIQQLGLSLKIQPTGYHRIVHWLVNGIRKTQRWMASTMLSGSWCIVVWRSLKLLSLDTKKKWDMVSGIITANLPAYSKIISDIHNIMSCDQLNKMLPERPSLGKNASGDRFLVRDSFDPAHMTGWP